jgi:hypothetical protein
MNADVMPIRLHLRGVRVTGVVVDTLTELVVGVVSVKKLSSVSLLWTFLPTGA